VADICLGIHSAYELYGNSAPENLKKLAASIPGYETRFKDRCSQVDALWKTFVPRSQYQKTNLIFSLRKMVLHKLV
jgi:hypothetical protein